MKSLKNLVSCIGLLFACQIATAAPVTLNFNTATSGPSYVENGMTITATSSEPVRTSGSVWFMDCCDAGPETFTLTTGGLFDLLSVYINHVDAGDPVTWTGLRNGGVVSSASFDSGQGSTYNFSGFVGLDMVRVSASGQFTDPSFDNLTYQNAGATVPEPGTLAIFGLGMVAFSVFRRRA